jgi:hypothetical protein
MASSTTMSEVQRAVIGTVVRTGSLAIRKHRAQHSFIHSAREPVSISIHPLFF